MYLVCVLQFRWRHVSDPAHCLQWRFIEEGRFSVHHFYHHNPERPDVHLWPIRQTGNHFGGHPVRRSHQ